MSEIDTLCALLDYTTGTGRWELSTSNSSLRGKRIQVCLYDAARGLFVRRYQRTRETPTELLVRAIKDMQAAQEAR